MYDSTRKITFPTTATCYSCIVVLVCEITGVTWDTVDFPGPTSYHIVISTTGGGVLPYVTNLIGWSIFGKAEELSLCPAGGGGTLRDGFVIALPTDQKKIRSAWCIFLPNYCCG